MATIGGSGMSSVARARFWLEVALGALSGGLFFTTLLVPEWIELAFGIDPDRGSGAFEILITVGFLTATIACGVRARLEHRRAQTASGCPDTVR